MGLKTALYSHLKGQYNMAFTAAVTNVITATGHTRINGDKVRLKTTDTLPAGLAVDTDYFVINKATNTFKLSASSGGSEINITDSGTGTHTLGTVLTDLITDRIYSNNAPQNPTQPYINYKRVSAARNHTLSGPDGLVTIRIQIDVYDDEPGVVETVMDALRNVLDGYDKNMGVELLDVRLISLEDENDIFINPIHADETGMHLNSMDFFITYAETAPSH